MGFFERNRDELKEKGIDPARLPPGQYSTDRFPVLHAGDVPMYEDLAKWDLTVFGQVENPLVLTWSELLAFPAVEVTTDIHCVTKWSKFDTHWRGVALSTIMEAARVRDVATHLMLHSEFGYTTNVSLAELLVPNRIAILAYEYAGKELEPEHGYPLRFFVPHLYFWKSAKWVRKIEFMVGDKPGFWERNGYHMLGDPFREQRFWDD